MIEVNKEGQFLVINGVAVKKSAIRSFYRIDILDAHKIILMVAGISQIEIRYYGEKQERDEDFLTLIKLEYKND